MAKMKPDTEEKFLKIKGVGDKKLLQYGDIFIAEINEFINKKEHIIKKLTNSFEIGSLFFHL